MFGFFVSSVKGMYQILVTEYFVGWGCSTVLGLLLDNTAANRGAVGSNLTRGV